METILFKYILFSLFYSAFFYVLYRLLIEKYISNVQKRIYLLFATLLSGLLPVIDFAKTKEAMFEIILPAVIVKANGTVGGVAESANISKSIERILFGIYLSIALVMAIIIIIQIIRIVINIIIGKKENIQGATLVKESKYSSPFSFWKWIFINMESNDQDYSRVLLHEKAHIKHIHSADLTLLGVIRCLQWFNPFIYLLSKELFAVHEFQADNMVINTTGNINSYRELILKQQLGYSPIIINSFRKSLTFKRLKEMENPENKRGRFYILPVAATLTLMLVFIVSATQISKARISNSLQTEIQKQQQDKTKEFSKYDKDNDVVPFAIVEVKPTFNGGDENTFTKWVFSKLEYPPQAKAQKIQGRVVVTFIVNTKGKVEDVKVIRGSNLLLDTEAVRVVSASPKWEPGMQKGKPVNVRYNFPVIFALK